MDLRLMASNRIHQPPPLPNSKLQCGTRPQPSAPRDHPELDGYDPSASDAAATSSMRSKISYFQASPLDNPPPPPQQQQQQHHHSIHERMLDQQQQQQQQQQHNFLPLAAYQQQQHQQSQFNPLRQAAISSAAGHFQQQHHQYFPFTASQWAELEHQALIFKYMMARAPIPLELIIPIRRSLILSPNSTTSWSSFQLGVASGNPLDAEPGRCRRTDGKKWRCSKAVVADQKYCERHMHRGRNRSRKAAQAAAAKAMNAQKTDNSTPIQHQQQQQQQQQQHQQHQQHPVPPAASNFDHTSSKHDERTSLQPAEKLLLTDYQSAKASEQRKTPEALRHFFDDWPRGSKDHSSSEFHEDGSSMDTAGRTNCLFPPLKLALDDRSSDDADDPYTNISLASVSGAGAFARSHHSWFSNTPSNPLGGPLAEALQNPGSGSQLKPVGFSLLDSRKQQSSINSNPVASPTGVLQKIACFSDCSSSASSPGSIRTDNIPHSLAQVE